MGVRHAALLFVNSFALTLLLLAAHWNLVRHEQDLWSTTPAIPPSICSPAAKRDPGGLQAVPELDVGEKRRLGPPPQQADVGDREGLARRLTAYDFQANRVKSDPALVNFLSDSLRWYLDRNDVNAECPVNTTLGEYWAKNISKNLTQKLDSWDRWHEVISPCTTYTDDVIVDLEKDLATLPLQAAEPMEDGTQVKLKVQFSNNRSAIFKPMRYGREYEANVNHMYDADFEQHTAEIAGYHLDKVLGFRRAIPTVGRVFNLTEIRSKSHRYLERTFFLSPGNNVCFVSRCSYQCNTTYAICGRPDMKEGALQPFLPEVKWDYIRTPYRRTYSEFDDEQLATWQIDQTYCEWKVKRKLKFTKGRLLLDLIDAHILNFLIGNQDLHFIERFAVWRDVIDASFIHFDFGQAFGNPNVDDLSIIAPLAQCCIIRPSTLQTLLHFYHHGPISLSMALHRSMENDPVSPILATKHYTAIERRLGIVIRIIKRCFDTRSDPDSIIMTTFKGSNEHVGEEGKFGQVGSGTPGNSKAVQT